MSDSTRPPPSVPTDGEVEAATSVLGMTVWVGRWGIDGKMPTKEQLTQACRAALTAANLWKQENG